MSGRRDAENAAVVRSAVRRLLAKVPGFCPVTGHRRCPWHPDGGNHPGVGRCAA